MHKRSARSLYLNGSMKSGGTSLFGGGGSMVLPTANNAGTIFKVQRVCGFQLYSYSCLIRTHANPNGVDRLLADLPSFACVTVNINSAGLNSRRYLNNELLKSKSQVSVIGHKRRYKELRKRPGLLKF